MTEKEILELLLQKVNEQGTILKEHTELLNEHSEFLKGHSELLKEHTEYLHAVRDAQEFQKAEIDRLNVTLAHIQGEQAEIREIIDNTAGDVSFLVRKAAKHDDDIRELKRVK
jgi:hypothetical protein